MLRLMGAAGSPYTRKMIAVLRYRRIPYALHWGGHQNPPPDLPQPKVKLLPTVYFETETGALEPVVDSTPIIRRLERDYAGRSVLPDDPALRFINDLIEDYADEWLTKAMFHFRWAHEADAENAAPLLVYWSAPTLPSEAAQAMAAMFAKRQIDRLYVVGSNDVTARTIEESYARFVEALDGVIQAQGYVLGARPSSADFALYGQLTQLALVEPTSAALTAKISQRVRAWVDRLEDLTGLEPRAEDWADRDAAARVLSPLLKEIGRVYAPFLVANAAAAARGDAHFDAVIDGRAWTQPTFAYQAKCLQWLREGFAALSQSDKQGVYAMLDGAGCGALLSEAP